MTTLDRKKPLRFYPAEHFIVAAWEAGVAPRKTWLFTIIQWGDVRWEVRWVDDGSRFSRDDAFHTGDHASIDI